MKLSLTFFCVSHAEISIFGLLGDFLLGVITNENESQHDTKEDEDKYCTTATSSSK